MVAITFPASSAPGRTKPEGAGVLMNAYAEELGPGAGSRGVIRRVPGLKLFTNTLKTGYRGQIRVNNTLYVAFAEKLVTVDVNGAVTEVPGALDGSNPVTFARNNKTPVPDVVVVTDLGVFRVTPSAITALADPDLPNPNSVCFLDGYFIFGIPDGRMFASGINATTVNAIDFATAESKPDPLVRVVAFGRQLFAFGAQSTEIWSNTANPTGFPFSRAAVMDRGVVGLRAVTGFEDGFGKALAWVGDDFGVHVLNGYEPQRISTPDVDRQIKATADKSAIIAGCYVLNGHACLYFSGPDWTWVYDLTTQAWHQRESYQEKRWRAAFGMIPFSGRYITADQNSGLLLEVAEDWGKEAGQPLVFDVISGPGQQFPTPLSVPRASFNFVPGMGIADGIEPIETDPVVEIYWSDDGGVTWSYPLRRSLGAQGLTRNEVDVRRTGRTGALGRRWRLRISDPIYVGLMGGEMVVEAR